jgi:uncharacterized protein (DUF433 family)
MLSANDIPIQQSDDILGGMPVLTGTRIPVRNLIDYLAGGQTIEEFLDDFPTVSREQVIRILRAAEEVLVANAGPRPGYVKPQRLI